jgi:tetratricopeptide (TPR) repeat protein
LAIEPNCLKVLYRIGKAYMALDEIDQAEKFFMRGFAIDPHEAEILKAL